jgi:hypothetical protein
MKNLILGTLLAASTATLTVTPFITSAEAFNGCEGVKYPVESKAIALPTKYSIVKQGNTANIQLKNKNIGVSGLKITIKPGAKTAFCQYPSIKKWRTYVRGEYSFRTQQEL